MTIARLLYLNNDSPVRVEKSPVRIFANVPTIGQRVRFFSEGHVREAAVTNIVWLASELRGDQQCDVELYVAHVS